jgi:hypothetical protein
VCYRNINATSKNYTIFLDVCYYVFLKNSEAIFSYVGYAAEWHMNMFTQYAQQGPAMGELRLLLKGTIQTVK